MINFNPLIGDLSTLKDSEVEEKVNELSRKYTIALRVGQSAVLSQILATLNVYRAELQARHQKILAAGNSQNKDLANLIKIN